MVFLGLKLQENRKKTGRKPEENRKKTKRKPKENQKKTKRKPKENQKKTKRKPKENQKKTKRKPKENQKKTKRKPKENQKKPTSERRQMALSRGGAEGRTAGPLGFGPHLRPLCGPPLQQQHDFWSSPVSVGSTRRVKKKKSEKKGKSIIGIFSRIFASLPASSSES